MNLNNQTVEQLETIYKKIYINANELIEEGIVLL